MPRRTVLAQPTLDGADVRLRAADRIGHLLLRPAHLRTSSNVSRRLRASSMPKALPGVRRSLRGVLTFGEASGGWAGDLGPRRRRGRRGAVEAGQLLGHVVEEEGDGHVEHAGKVEQAGGADAVDAALILLDLLEGQAERFAKLLLGHAQQGAAQPDAGADMGVDRAWPGVLVGPGGGRRLKHHTTSEHQTAEPEPRSATSAGQGNPSHVSETSQ